VVAEGAGPGTPYSNLDIAAGGAKAAAKAINDAGGVNGHPLDIVTCDTKNNPNDAAACGRDLVSQGVAAMVGSISGYGAQIYPVLAAAHIATLGQISVSAADLSTENVYSFAPSGIDVAAGEPDLAARLGATKISLVRVDLSATASLPQLAAIGLKPHNLQLVNNVALPMNAPDMSSYVAAAAANGTDAICMILQPNDLVNFIKAAKDSGFQGKLVSDSANLLRGVQNGFATTLEGVYALDEFKPASLTTDPAVAKFNAEVDAVDPKSPKDYTVENAWAAVYLFAQIASSLPTIDAASVLAAVPSVTKFDIGLLPPIDLSKTIDVVPGLRIYNPYVFTEQVKGGQLVAVSNDFVNLLAPTAGS
jgi:branched-chain amino acid transport system substrate-binding protein